MCVKTNSSQHVPAPDPLRRQLCVGLEVVFRLLCDIAIGDVQTLTMNTADHMGGRGGEGDDLGRTRARGGGGLLALSLALADGLVLALRLEEALLLGRGQDVVVE